MKLTVTNIKYRKCFDCGKRHHPQDLCNPRKCEICGQELHNQYELIYHPNCNPKQDSLIDQYIEQGRYEEYGPNH